MKRLRIKLFVTLFTILSIFSLSLLIFNNVREYTHERHEIERVFERNTRRVKFKVLYFAPSDNILEHNDVFIDYNVFTFKLNDDGTYNDLIKGVYEDEKILNKAISYAKKVTKSNLDDEKINLIFGKYSFKRIDNTLLVVDNTYQSNRVIRYLISSICVFLIAEVVSIVICKFLVKWMVKPVEESFEREKRFIGDASHELKTPIAVIMASADAYSQDKNVKWLNNIKSESDHMNKLVTELLDLNNLENNQKEFKKDNTNLSKLIESSILPYESLFFEKNLKFDYDIQKDIYHEVNESKIKELMSILIDNAVKYSSEHGHVRVNLSKSKDIILSISNEGDEISPEDIEKIFDRFYKVDKSRNRKDNSYGLGLSIAKRIVELHNGNITVSSEKGTTTFTIKF